MKTTFTIILLMWCACCQAQINGDSTLNNTLLETNHDTVSSSGERSIEIYKINSNKIFLLNKGQNVWVRCQNKDGKIKIKRAKILAVSNHEITFKPYDLGFSEVIYDTSEIMYIGFTSTGRVLIASISNILIISAVVIICVIVTVAAILSGGSGIGGGFPNFSGILVPSKKNIDFSKTKSGNRKWFIRIVKFNPQI